MKSKDLLLKDVLLIESALLYDLNKEINMQINEVPNAKVGIVAGSKSDQETVDKITAVLDSFGIVWEYNILLPVIGLPCAGGPLNGVDALHSIVQMPPGIPVATVGIGNGKNAGYLAAHIVAIADPAVREKLVAYRKSLGDIEG